MRVVAVVPVKATSDRVQAKNFREFYEGKSAKKLDFFRFLRRVPKI